MRKKYRNTFLILFFVTISFIANAQSEHITIEHDHSKCNHDHDKPSALSLKMDSCKTIITGKWRNADGSDYQFLPLQKLLIGKRPASEGKWEVMGQEGNVILRLWTTNEQGALSPRFYNIIDIDKAQFTIGRMFGGNDTLQFSKLSKSIKK
jgi:hypothetical protein